MVSVKDIDTFFKHLLGHVEPAAWDNCGLQTGNYNSPVKRVMFCLSVTVPAIDAARSSEIDLIVSHHPLTIEGLKSVTDKGYPEILYMKLIESGIAVYSLHTNLDISELGPSFIIAEKLQLKNIELIPVSGDFHVPAGSLEEPLNQSELVKRLKNILSEDVYRGINYRPNETVNKVAVCSGSCASIIDDIYTLVDVLITGDVKYHDAIKAADLGLTVLDMGHFGTEHFFHEKLIKKMKEKFPELSFYIFEGEKSPYEVL